MPEAEFTLRTRLTEVRGIAPRVAAGLAALGPRNVGQLLAHLPFKHERQEAETPIAELVAGRLVSTRGTVSATRVAGRRGARPRFEAVLIDDTGRLDLVWFNAPYLQDAIHPGVRLRVQGKAKTLGRQGGLQIPQPRHEILKDDRDEPAARDSRLRPVYPASEAITSSQIEKAIGKILPRALTLIEDHLAAEYLRSRELCDLATAYRWLHAPEAPEQAEAGRRRLAYDELLFLQVGLARRRFAREHAQSAPALAATEAIDRRIRARFPFALTPAQDAVVAEVATDLARAVPANRLIQGDVGSGKTAVALYAMLLAVAHKQQAALMAPTELLAEQHHASISRLLAGSAVRPALLTGSLTSAARRELERGLADGSQRLVIGTHALLTGSVKFASLGVVVIDEQHRFGAAQRAGLTTRGGTTPALAGGPPVPTPHTLVMTATPIPRSLGLTLFGELDISTITGLPPGRKPVKTRVVAPQLAAEVYTWVAGRLAQGEQAYVVAPAIDAGDEPGAMASVKELHARLSAGPLAGRRLAMLHGQMPQAEREGVMSAFRRGQIDVLIATTIIEVGVDVPNATVMVIEHAERFGLAQLHQLRGRVGRGSRASACILIAEPLTTDAQARLEAVSATTDGFKLAEHDLQIRGIGELLGLRQSGVPDLKSADLSRDLELLTMARRDAQGFVDAPAIPRSGGSALFERRLKLTHLSSIWTPPMN